MAATVAGGLVSLLGRYWSSRIGEGLIFDLRTRLYDHVQRMPLAFFTNSQTGSLSARLNNDVVGAQRAVTGTLGTVVDNVVTVVTTLVAMILLDWRLTLLALAVLPFFLVGSKRVGRTLRAITREGMELNASMNTTDDRALRRRRRPARQAVRPPAATRRPASATRPTGCATSACAAPCSAARSGSASSSSAPSAWPPSTGSAASW